MIERVERPWGVFETFSHNENVTVKIITLLPHEMTSLQYHKKRSEYWYVISGHPIIQIDKVELKAKPGSDFSIDMLVKHRLGGGQSGAKILEVSKGDFDEDDIVRVEDKYDRV